MGFSLTQSLRSLVEVPDLALDVGTGYTRVYARGLGFVTEAPTAIAFDGPQPGFGTPKEYVEAGIRFPLSKGVVTDVVGTTELLHSLFRRIRKWRPIVNPRVLVCTPSDASLEERELLTKACLRAGARETTVFCEPMAAAIGSGLDVSEPFAQLLVDIGEGVTDVAVIRSGELVATRAVRKGCRDVKKAIDSVVLKRFDAHPTPAGLQRLMAGIGFRTSRNKTVVVIEGRDWMSGHHRSIPVEGKVILDALEPVMAPMIAAILELFKSLPERLSIEVIESGIHLTGGGSLIPGVAKAIEDETRLVVKTVSDPLLAVIRGAGMVLETTPKQFIWK